jgi:hypothetical protein
VDQEEHIQVEEVVDILEVEEVHCNPVLAAILTQVVAVVPSTTEHPSPTPQELERLWVPSQSPR